MMLHAVRASILEIQVKEHDKWLTLIQNVVHKVS